MTNATPPVGSHLGEVKFFHINEKDRDYSLILIDQFVLISRKRDFICFERALMDLITNWGGESNFKCQLGPK